MAQINPEMIVLARESRALTQAELAGLLNISKGRMSKIEHGFLDVPDDLLEAISRELRYPTEMFFSEFRPFPAGLPFYRKHKTLQAKAQTQIVAEMNLYRKHVNDLMKDVDITFQRFPECDLDEYGGDPRQVAQAIRYYLNLPRGPVVDLTRLLENAGIIIIPLDAPTHKFSGASMLLENANHLLFVNANTPADRLRFTLAHELGHVVMHRLPTPNLESEADDFAREFLMPTNEIKPSLSDLNLAKLATLKRYWRVSMGAILVHANRIGVIGPRQYQYLWTQMGKAGYRMREPAELDFPKDEPSMLNEVVGVHISDLGYTLEELGRKLDLYPQEFSDKFRQLPSNRGLRLVRTH
jgi:Zn-dependent peptidase ImmA (M78 family)/transcriptional regulator with XRE-family HTH domain